MKKIIPFLVPFCFIGCKTSDSQNGAPSVSSTTAVVETASAVMSGVADDEAGSAMAMNDHRLRDLIFPRAYATTSCQRPFYATCSAGEKLQTYDDCALSSGTMNGDADLTYSNAGCTFNAINDTVTRTYAIAISGPPSPQVAVQAVGMPAMPRTILNPFFSRMPVR